MKLLRKLLILTHRYLGIVFSALIVMWFATGITMMYTGGMPELTPERRLDGLDPVDLGRVRFTPAEAAARAEFEPPPSRASLVSVLGRPAYRFGDRDDTVIVFADTGGIEYEFSPAQTQEIASRFMRVPRDRVHFVAALDNTDQWTVGMARALPLHKYRVDDGEGTEVYVSPFTADVALVTTSRTRGWAWVSAIPHWLYFKALRDRPRVWFRVVVWTSAIATALAVLGVVLGFTQYRRGRPTLKASIPYAGWMRWHYITGAVFGLFAVTWAFSGLLSMEPFAWTNAEGIGVPAGALSGGRLDLAAFPRMSPDGWQRLLGGAPLKEVELARMQGDPYYIVHRGSAPLIVSAATLQPRTEPFSTESIVSRVEAAVTDAPIADVQLLNEYDSYYYARGGEAPLPVVRIRFADRAATWLYIDPQRNRMLASIPRLKRVERWLYHGFHSLDVGYLYTRPLWDVVMIVLLGGGLATSAIGLYLGVKRIIRAILRRMPRTEPASAA
jgi:hypothetical protein